MKRCLPCILSDLDCPVCERRMCTNHMTKRSLILQRRQRSAEYIMCIGCTNSKLSAIRSRIQRNRSLIWFPSWPSALWWSRVASSTSNMKWRVISWVRSLSKKIPPWSRRELIFPDTIMRNRNTNKLCCIVGNIPIMGESNYPCTCMFRYCHDCFQEWRDHQSRYFREYNMLVDAHYEFDPTCPYNVYLIKLLEHRLYESQRKNEATKEGIKDKYS